MNEETVQIVQHGTDCIDRARLMNGQVEIISLSWWQFSDDHQVQIYNLTKELACTCSEGSYCQHIQMVHSLLIKKRGKTGGS